MDSDYIQGKAFEKQTSKEIINEVKLNHSKTNKKTYINNKKYYNISRTEDQKIKNLLDNTTSQPSKFRTKNWFGINDEVRGTYNSNSQFKCKTII